MRNLWSQFSAISKGFPPILVDFGCVSINLLLLSISFNQFPSILIRLNQFDSAKKAGPQKPRKRKSPESTLTLERCPKRILRGVVVETVRIRFRGVRFQTPNSVSFFGLTEFRGANSVSSSQPIICVPKRTHRVFRRTHRVCRKTNSVRLSEFSSFKQYSRNSIPPVS